jgi:eukaryotic-like serine/threonine-protein kinase
MALNPGTKLGPYEVVGPLGAGGMGEVYRCEDTRLGRHVAIKLLPESLAKDGDRLRRFELEAKTVATLNHPNILGIHDIGKYDGAPFLVSELLEGETLRQKIDSGPIPTRRAVEYALGIARGLAAAHDKGVVHRDLKPENIFITRDGRVKILDFGLAKLVRDEHSLETAMTLTSPTTMPGVVMGTIGYMSPEQVKGQPSDERSDIFSFGAVLYEMLTGKRAFKRDTSVETMTAILKEEPPELTDSGWQGPIGLQRILTRCLEKDPNHRFQSASDLAFAIEALSGTGTSVSQTAAAAAIQETGRSRKWIWLLAGALACAAAGGAIAWSLQPGPKPVPTFQRMSYERATLVRGRFAADGKTVVYSGVLTDGVPDTYVIRADYPTSVSAGLHGAIVLAISRQDQMAVLVRPHFYAQNQWGGTLASVPLGGSGPREMLDNVYDADWSPDGKDLAVIDHSGDKWRLQYPIGKVLLTTDNWLSDLRVSPDGTQVAFFQHPISSRDDRGVVVVMDRDGKQKVVSREWEALEGMAWRPDGKEVWYGAAEAGDQYCVRASNPKGQERTVYCGTSGTRVHDISPSEKALVSADVQVISITSVEHGSKEEHNLVSLGFVLDPKITPDGREVVTTDASVRGGKDYSVNVQKRDSGSSVKIAEGGYGWDVSDDGKYVLVAMPGQDKLQIVPVGAGESQILKWEGFQIASANWFPDNQHILLFASPPGQPVGLYMTDRKGTAPKMLLKDAPEWADVMPDGQNLLLSEDDGSLVQRSIQDGSEKKLTALQEGERPLDWAKEPMHLFTELVQPTGITVNKLDLTTGRREEWFAFKPQNQDGAMLNVTSGSITPDGRWMMFNYDVPVGQFYVSETLR